MLLLPPGPPSEHIAFDIDVSFRIAFDVYASFRILLNHLAVIQSLPLHLSSLLQLIFPGIPCDAQWLIVSVLVTHLFILGLVITAA